MSEVNHPPTTETSQNAIPRGDKSPQRPEKLHPRYGWYPIYRADIARIIQAGQHSTSAIAVWLALMDLANSRQSFKFNAGKGLIASIAGISRRTVDYALTVLEELRMVKRKQNKKVKRKTKTDFFDDSTYQIFPASETPSPAKAASRKICATPPASHVPHNLLNDLTISPLLREGEREEGLSVDNPVSASPQSLPLRETEAAETSQQLPSFCTWKNQSH